MLLLRRIRLHGSSEESLQGCRFDASLAKLAGGAGCWGESFHRVALRLSRITDDGKRGRFARACVALNRLNAVCRTEYILDDTLLRSIQMGMLFGNSNRLLPRQNWSNLIAPFFDPTQDFMLRCDGRGRGELPRW